MSENQTIPPNIFIRYNWFTEIKWGVGQMMSGLIKINGLCCLSTMFLVWEVVGCIWITQVDDDTFFCKRNIETSHNSIHQKGGEKAKQKKKQNTDDTTTINQPTKLFKIIIFVYLYTVKNKFQRTILIMQTVWYFTELVFPVYCICH